MVYGLPSVELKGKILTQGTLGPDKTEYVVWYAEFDIDAFLLASFAISNTPNSRFYELVTRYYL